MSQEQMIEMQVSFNPDVADAAAERETYNAGVVFSKVASAKKQISKDKEDLDVSPNYLMFVLNLVPLSNPDDPSSGVGRGLTTYQCLPFEPPHWEEAFEAGELDEGTLTKWRSNLKIFAQTMHQVLHALMPDEIPDVPRKSGDGWIYNGEEIEKDDIETCKAEAYKASGSIAEQLWNSGLEVLEDTGCYHHIIFETNKATGVVSDWPSTKWFYPDVPVRNGQLVEVMTGDAIMGSASNPEAAKKNTNGKTGRAKPAKKKASKKKASKRKRN